MINNKSALLFLSWLLVVIALLFNSPRPQFTLLDPFSPSHLFLLAAFFLSSLYLLSSKRHRFVGFIHLFTLITLFLLHPYSGLFGRDGTLIIFGVYLLCFIFLTPLLKSEHRLLTVTIFICFVTVEMLVPKWFEKPAYTEKDLKEWADFVDGYNLHEGGYLLPQIDAEIVGEFGASKFVTNKFGFRNAKDVGYIKPKSTYRVILIGDSFVAGYRTDQADTIGYVLEQKMQEAVDETVEVLIAGVHDPAWAARYVDRYALKFNPDLVIVGITLGNDISGNYITASGQRFNDQKIRGSILPGAAFDVSGLRGLLLRLSRSLSSWEIYRLARRTIRNDPVISWHHDYPRYVHTFDIYHALGHFYTGSNIEIVNDSFRLLEHTLQRIKTAAEQNGVELIVVLFSQRFQVHNDDWRHTLFSYGLKEAVFDKEAPNRKILKFCAHNQIKCLDVLPELRKSGSQLLFFPLGDMHMNTVGQEVTAKAMTEYILRNKLAD